MGDIPIAGYVSAEKFIQDAADEIDSQIGFVYVTPVVLEDIDKTRPARLLLKRINAHLATGRLIMALDAGGQDDRLHAYGYSLIKEATAALAGIAKGEIELPGATPLNPSSGDEVKGIIINNLDPESNVEAFYNRVAAPGYSFGLGESYLR